MPCDYFVTYRREYNTKKIQCVDSPHRQKLVTNAEQNPHLQWVRQSMHPPRSISESKTIVTKKTNRRIAISALLGLLATPVIVVAQPVADEGVALANPYGVQAIWAQGDLVARGTLLILVLMSMISWYVMVAKYLEQARVNRLGREVGDDFWDATSVQQSADQLQAQSPYRFIVERGLESASKHHGLLGTIDFNTWVTMSLQRAIGTVQSSLQNGLSMLATVGSIAPFVGLFGTVWGIYNALVSIGLSGQASIDKVAGPVGESLIMTAIGLAVAVPAVLGYNWLVRRNKVVMENVHAFGNDLHAVLLASASQR
jgi:biopolymer transport protein ExbB